MAALNELLTHSSYDKEIIRGLPLYDSLKEIIISNIDTIFKYRNSKHFVYYGGGKDSGKLVQENSTFYDFYYDYGEPTALSYGKDTGKQKLIDEISLENMPAYIYPSVRKIFQELGRNKIKGFKLETDSTMEIILKSSYDKKNNADVLHTLIWKRAMSEDSGPDVFTRDSILAPKWAYMIWVEERPLSLF